MCWHTMKWPNHNALLTIISLKNEKFKLFCGWMLIIFAIMIFQYYFYCISPFKSLSFFNITFIALAHLNH